MNLTTHKLHKVLYSHKQQTLIASLRSYFLEYVHKVLTKYYCEMDSHYLERGSNHCYHCIVQIFDKNNFKKRLLEKS